MIENDASNNKYNILLAIVLVVVFIVAGGLWTMGKSSKVNKHHES
jgi:heme/copper-type cytochrome/quinol oxidase subunit 4